MTKQIKIVPSGVNSIDSVKMFTYPTRLASAWKADILQIQIPGYELERPGFEITIDEGTTNKLFNRKRVSKLKQLPKKIFTKISKSIDLGERYIFDARDETDGNIAHIVKNIAPGLLAAQKLPPQISEITVILRENSSQMAKTAYKLLGFSTLCTDKNVKGKIIEAPTGRFGQYEVYYQELFGKLSFEEYQKDTPKRIFISRKGNRNLMNESQIEKLLLEYGFNKFYYEDIPISQQWSIGRNAEVVVGLHGAALSSLFFNQNQVKLIELFHPGYVTHAFRHTVYAVGGSWCGVTGQITENVIRDLDFKYQPRKFASSSTKIELNSLKMALEHLKINPIV